MKKVFLFIVFVIFTNIAYSQWQSINHGIFGGNVYALAANGNNVFAGTSGGVLLSTDNGNSWGQKNNGLTNKHIY